MRSAFLLLAAMLTSSALGCAAPNGGEDADVGGADQANSVDESVELAAALKSSLSTAKLEILADRYFEAKTNNAKVGLYGAVMCVFALGTGNAGVLPKVPQGDVYTFDAKGPTLSREDAFLVWSIPLTNEKTRSGAPGTRANFTLRCSQEGVAPTARYIRGAIENGWNSFNPREPATVRLSGVAAP